MFIFHILLTESLNPKTRDKLQKAATIIGGTALAAGGIYGLHNYAKSQVDEWEKSNMLLNKELDSNIKKANMDFNTNVSDSQSQEFLNQKKKQLDNSFVQGQIKDQDYKTELNKYSTLKNITSLQNTKDELEKDKPNSIFMNLYSKS